MIVVADTSPLNYLVQLGIVQVLPQMYGRVLIPEAVLIELRHAVAPPGVREWVHVLPEWVVSIAIDVVMDEQLAVLDSGEREAICLAMQSKASLLLMDDRAGASVATERNISVLGTLGVLVAASDAGLIDLRPTAERLFAETNFRLSAAMKAKFRALYVL